jgi:gluconate 5-dehydrogenase
MPDLSVFDLTGKAALVTGGTTGIGLGMARGLARAGATVAICGRDAAKGEAAAEELRALNEHCRFFAIDLEDTESLPEFYRQVSESMRRNAAVIPQSGTGVLSPLPASASHDDGTRGLVVPALAGPVCAPTDSIAGERTAGPAEAATTSPLAEAPPTGESRADSAPRNEEDAVGKGCSIEPSSGGRAGGIDILVNNAAINVRGRAEDIALADFERVQRVNVTAPFVLAQCFARERIATARPGNIVFTASLMSEAARPTTAPYTASKGGVRQLVRALAVDWAPHGIRVNGIGPGYIETEMTRPLRDQPEFDAWVRRRTPLGRWGRPGDFEGAVVFLASDAARFVTGQILYVDGGWLATF